MTSSINIILTGDSSSLSTHFHPEIELDERFDYSCCLLEFSAENFSWNDNNNNTTTTPSIMLQVEEGKNEIDYVFPFFIGSEILTIKVPPGLHEFDFIAQYIVNEINKKRPDDVVRVKLDLTTMLCTIEKPKKTRIIMTSPQFMSELLGFQGVSSQNDIETSITGTNPIKTVSVVTTNDDNNNNNSWNSTAVAAVVRIDCDLITTGSVFHNTSSTHTLYEFYPTTPNTNNNKMIVQPSNLIYLPLTRQRHTIASVHLTILDQNNRPIDFNSNNNNNKVRINCLLNIKREPRYYHQHQPKIIYTIPKVIAKAKGNSKIKSKNKKQ